jgi:hypothetical protein
MKSVGCEGNFVVLQRELTFMDGLFIAMSDEP